MNQARVSMQLTADERPSLGGEPPQSATQAQVQAYEKARRHLGIAVRMLAAGLLALVARIVTGGPGLGYLAAAALLLVMTCAAVVLRRKGRRLMSDADRDAASAGLLGRPETTVAGPSAQRPRAPSTGLRQASPH